ncbi:MAG: PIN domain-containing protein [Pirellulaceae bacterium]
MLVLVDTNVVLRIVETGHPHHQAAADSMRKIRQRGDTLCLLPQVHYEFWVAATRPVANNGLGLSSSDALAELKQLGPPLFRFLKDERAIYQAWLGVIGTHSVQGKAAHDARLVAAMERHGVTHLLTFNTEDFVRYRHLTVLDPQTV